MEGRWSSMVTVADERNQKRDARLRRQGTDKDSVAPCRRRGEAKNLWREEPSENTLDISSVYDPL